MGCGISMIKYLLFFFNLVVALCGLAILAIGVVFHLQLDDVTKMLEEWNVQAAPVIFITVGSIVFIIAFFGCCGAIRESHCMTVSYAVFLIIILIIQVVIAVFVFIYIDDVTEAVQKALEKNFANRDSQASKEIIDGLQTNLHCCGVNGPSDYSINSLVNLPSSCCPPETQICSILGSNSYQTGCKKALFDLVRTAGNTIGAVALGIAAVEVIGAIFALCLANSIRNQDRRFNHY